MYVNVNGKVMCGLHTKDNIAEMPGARSYSMINNRWSHNGNQWSTAQITVSSPLSLLRVANMCCVAVKGSPFTFPMCIGQLRKAQRLFTTQGRLYPMPDSCKTGYTLLKMCGFVRSVLSHVLHRYCWNVPLPMHFN